MYTSTTTPTSAMSARCARRPVPTAVPYARTTRMWPSRTWESPSYPQASDHPAPTERRPGLPKLAPRAQVGDGVMRTGGQWGGFMTDSGTSPWWPTLTGRRANGRVSRGRAALGRRRAHAALLVGLFAALPLQWQTVGGTPLGELRYFHLPALLVVARFAIGPWAWRLWRRLPATHRSLVPLFGLYTGAALVGTAVNDGPATNYAQQASYAVVGTCVAVFLADATKRQQVSRIMWWGGPAALTFLLFFFSVDARAVGVDAAATFQQAFVTADPQVINFRLFSRVFNAETEETSIGLRHGVFGAVLATSYLSVWAMSVRRPRRPARWGVWGMVGVSAGLIVLSLSRSVIVALVMVAILPFSRLILTGKFRRRGPGGLFFVAGGLAMLAPAWSVLSNRFLTDSGSYGSREGAITSAVGAIGQNPLFGRPAPELTAHNFILDAWAGAGLLAGLAAALFALGLVRCWLGLYAVYLRRPSLVVAVGLAAGFHPLVRMITAGGGTLDIGVWVNIGLFVGIAAAVQSGQPTSIRAPQNPGLRVPCERKVMTM